MLVATPSQIDRPTKRTMEALMQQLVEANIASGADGSTDSRLGLNGCRRCSFPSCPLQVYLEADRD